MTQLEILNLLTIIVRFATLVPFGIFFYTQLKRYGMSNGMVWRVRRLTLVLVGTIGVSSFTSLFIRVVLGYSTGDITVAWISLALATFFLFLIWWAWYEVREIGRH